MEPINPFPNTEICSHCHVAILYPHPEEKFAILGHMKCCFCGFTKIKLKEIKDIHKIVNGK